MSTLKPRTASHIIYQGDDLAHLAELRQAAELAKRAAQAEYDKATRPGSALRIGDADDSTETAKAAYDEATKPTQDAYDAAVDEAAERAVEVTVQAIGRRRFRELLAEHPPRKGDDGETHPDDAAYGVNEDTFPLALLAYDDGDTTTIVDPEFPTAAKRKAFLEDELSDGDFEQLWTTAYTLNRGLGRDPKVSKFSTGSQRLTEI